MPHTLVIADRQGRLCNRLWVFSHVIAFALEHDCQVWNPAFGEYAPYFEATAADGLCRWPAGCFPLRSPWFRRGVYDLLRLWRRVLGGRGGIWLKIPPGEELALDRPENAPVVERLVRARRTFLEGWGVRDVTALRRHANAIRAFFTPVAAYRASVDRLLSGLRAGGGTLVGVHIRRGDYRAELPQWFYGLDVYVRLLHGLRERLEMEGRTVRFLVASDEELDAGLFAGLDVTFCHGDEVEDLYSLAECDRIVGPPSTYSAWAAFMGGLPLCHLREAGQAPGLGDFRDNPFQ